MQAVKDLISANPYYAFGILMAIMAAGDIVSHVTKGWFPSGLAILFLIVAGFWTILPATLAADAGIAAGTFKVAVVLLITHLGTMIKTKQMIAQWRTVVISLMGIVAICVFCMLIGAPIFGRMNAIVAAPVLTGAAIAASIMAEAAASVGDSQAQLLAMVVMSVQQLYGMPLCAFAIRKECERLGVEYKAGRLKATAESSEENAKKRKSRLVTANTILTKLMLVVILAYLLEKATKGYVSTYVWCLVLGFVASETGFLEENALGKAKADGYLMIILLGYLFCSLSYATWEMLRPVLLISIGMAAVSTVGLVGAAFIASKIFKKYDESFWGCFSVVLNAYLGFPLNVMLVNEAMSRIEDPEEREVLNGEIMPKQLVAGFVCVTIVSVFVAGVFAKLV